MRCFCSHVVLALVFATAPAFANVIVNQPGNGETVGSPATFAATANTTTCSRGVAAMGVYIDNELVYTVDGAKLDAALKLASGKHNAVIQEWDYCGGATKAAVPITVETSKGGVWVTSPATNASVSGLANYVATATTTCPAGVAAMGIYVNNQREYLVSGAKLNTQLQLSPGSQQTVVQEWDNCGGTAVAPVNLTVTTSGNTFNNLQATKGWNSWGQLAPTYADCAAPCTGVTWSMKQGEAATSLTGNGTQFNIGGTTPYSDVLWENPLIGQFSTQGLPDRDQALLPTLHNFTYDAWFFVSDAAVTQALEFDVNMFMNTVGMTWGTECRIEGGNEWDTWDNAAAKWVPSGAACNPINGGWNHVTINVQREADNTLLYESITLNGKTSILNKTSAPFSVPADWYGITVNYQMDGDHKQNAYTAYLDKFSFTYR
jgi:hypothetical protein